MSKRISMVGEVFGDFTIIEDNGRKALFKCIRCGVIEDKFKASAIKKGDFKCLNCQILNLKDMAGRLIGSTEVIEDLDSESVKVKCLECGVVYLENKYALTQRLNKWGNHLGCQKCNKKMGRVDTLGAVHNKLKIVEDLVGRKVKVQCQKCGLIQEKFKYAVVNNSASCTNCYAEKDEVKSSVGEVYNNLKILEELEGHKVKVQCEKCGLIQDKNRYSVIKSTAACTNCSTRKKRIIGEVYNNLKVLEELEGYRVKVQCQKCGLIQEKFKQAVVENRACCLNCSKKEKVKNVTERKGRSRINRVGEIYNNLKILEELGYNKVKVQCIYCGNTQEKNKHSLVNSRSTCDYCGYNHVKSGVKIGSIELIAFKYVTRDKEKYYSCRCIKCKKEFILNRQEMLEHKCEGVK